jgi:flagellar hook assembly protein FlgD
MSAGFHELRWDGKDIQGIPVSTGMYIYRFTANSKESKKQYVENQKMVMMK